MTLQQLRLVIESADKGSISAAAEKMKISQPNASLSIKKLEEELGYSLFRRVGGGISPTEQGYLFLEHAQALLDEDSAIRSISSGQSVRRLRVGAMNFSAAIEAFLHFCSEAGNSSSMCDLTCINVAPETGIKLLKERRLDVVVSLVVKDLLPALDQICSENRFSYKKHAVIPSYIRVRRDHPLVADGTLDGTPKSFRRLGAYPYADYRHLEHIMGLYNQTSSVVSYGCSYKIYVDERDTRLKVLSETDAYSVGIRLTEEVLEKYGLVQFPTGVDAIPVTIVRKGDEKLSDIGRYLELLNEEISRINR